jgi:hypothetical protein
MTRNEIAQVASPAFAMSCDLVAGHGRNDCNLAEAWLRELFARPFHKYSRPSRTDMRGVRRASVSEEGGPWGKHGFPHGATAPDAREAV